jgi:hypothetical protein
MLEGKKEMSFFMGEGGKGEEWQWKIYQINDLTEVSTSSLQKLCNVSESNKPFPTKIGNKRDRKNEIFHPNHNYICLQKHSLKHSR